MSYVGVALNKLCQYRTLTVCQLFQCFTIINEEKNVYDCEAVVIVCFEHAFSLIYLISGWTNADKIYLQHLEVPL